ncbi:hypothetical protein P691DRAFT_754266 [Macrolepiota fuliginosa MF-IS2]|uniref:Uncharacterized protein n=1 Tax=Macrolepiota fuliginosa MF-IS2 TaxID=1400762 RepID=A0A9P5XS56_9AGAR|nr:hypothetical protein P691DRAFT_754266 [Macrolepiota fuliginosa MF-IS2]
MSKLVGALFLFVPIADIRCAASFLLAASEEGSRHAFERATFGMEKIIFAISPAHTPDFWRTPKAVTVSGPRDWSIGLDGEEHIRLNQSYRLITAHIYEHYLIAPMRGSGSPNNKRR